MLRRALTTLFCSLALVAPAFSQDVFVPRELKAVPVHPLKPKEVVRRAEPVTDADLKALPKESGPSAESAKSKTPKTDLATAKTEKTAKADAAKEKSDKPAAPKEKSAVTKAPAATDDMVTIKVEKAPATKALAKTETAKEKKDKPAPAKEKADSDLPTIKIEKVTAAKESSAPKTAAKTETAKSEKAAPPKDESAHKSVAKSDSVKVETVTAKTEKPAVKEKPATVAASRSLREDKIPAKEEPTSKATPKTESAKSEVVVAKTEKAASVKEKEKSVTTATKPLVAKVEPAPPREGPVNPVKLPMKSEQVSVPAQKDPPQIIPTMNGSLDTGFVKIADGFDFPVGKPEAEGYYKARGFRPGGHVGEDWDGVGGGDTDLGDPIYSIGDGIVVFARDVHLGWGNVVIVRHAYRDGGTVKYIDSLYGHLNTMLVRRGQRITRGQQIATMGTAHGQYDAHLHFEIRKNLEIGMSRSKFQKDFSNYYDPTQFISSHRHLSGGGANYKVAMNTFTHDWAYHFDSNRNFGPRKRGTSESSAALRRAVTSR
jgi:murein DD-endopeptidase MepM/ murein hydrolase activator NlpD